ncbi:asparaginase, partial [Salmonella enterica subsp. enterica serovar Saintpaul]
YAGYPGSETSLLSKGLISSGFLDGRKARLLLILMLMSGFDMDGIREGFRIFSKECE